VAALVGGIVNDAQALMKQELALARREVADALHKVKEAAVFLGVAIALAACGGLLLVLMLVYLLHWTSSVRLPLWGCYGIVGAALMVLAGGLLFFARRRAGAVHLMPEHSLATMKDNVAWIKNLTSTRNGLKQSGTTSTKHVAP